MGMEIAKAFVTVGLDKSRLNADFEALKSELGGKFNALTTSANASMQATAEKLEAMQASAILLASYLLKKWSHWGTEFIHHGSEVSDSLEEIEVELRQLTGSAERAEEAMSEIQKFARKNGMTVKSVHEMGRNFLIAGHSVESMIAHLQLAGDASGGMIRRMQMLVSVMHQMESGVGGRGPMQYFRTLSREGIVTIQDLAKHYKVSEEAAKKMVLSGRVQFSDLKKILVSLTSEGGRFHNAMQKMAGTQNRLNLAYAEAVNLLAMQIAKPLDRYLHLITREATALVHALKDFMEWGGEALSWAFIGGVAFASMGGVIASLTAAWQGLNVVLGLVGATFALTFPEFALVIGVAIAAAAAITAVGAALGWIAGTLQIPKLLANAWGYFKDVILKSGIVETIYNWMDVWSRFLETVQIVWNDVDSIIGNFLKGFFGQADNVLRFLVKMWVEPGRLASIFFLEIMENIQVLALNAKILWENWSVLAATAFLYVLDISSNVAQNMVSIFKSAAGEILAAFVDSFAEIAIEFLKTFGPIAPAIARQLQEATGMTGKALAKKMGLKADENLPGLFDMKERTLAFMKQFGVTDILEKLGADKEALVKKRRINQGGEPELGEGKENAKMPKAGIYAIPEFGRQIQTALLEKKDDRVANLLEMGNGIQQQQLITQQNLLMTVGLA